MSYESMSITTKNTMSIIQGEGLIPVISRWFNWLLLCTAVLTLSGCASIKVTPNPIDSPPPSEAVLGTKPVYCLQLGEKNYDYKLNRRILVKLAPGESCWYVVQSDAVFNHTGLQYGDYEITVPDGQFMFDATRQVNVPEGDDGTCFTRIFNYAKRQPDSQWFVLVAATCGDATHEQAINSNTNEIKMSEETALLVGERELCFYVNDVPRYYQNNSGRVWINIKKL